MEFLLDSDLAKVIKWLGYDPTVHISKDKFTNTFEDPGLDYLVLLKVRETGYGFQQQFVDNINGMLQGEEGLYALLMSYKPGMYAQAARFLWEKDNG